MKFFPNSAGKLALLKLMLSMAILITLAYVLWFACFFQVDQSRTIIINHGAGSKEISALVVPDNVISQRLLQLSFYLIANLKHRYVIAGEYELTQGMSANEIVNKLIKGERLVRKITIPEGYTNFQIGNLITDMDELKGEIKTLYSEGYLFPSTYHYYYGDSKQSIVDRMKSEMDKLLNSYNLKDVEKVLVLASIVEKEARLDSERKLIASVYLNRINIGMPLQADPTVIYGLFGGKTDFKHQLTKADLSYVSPHNTYMNIGLPPTPIANPGKASILAVIQPASTTWLYFVSDGKGGHRFASNLKDHNNNIKLWLAK